MQRSELDAARSRGKKSAAAPQVSAVCCCCTRQDVQENSGCGTVREKHLSLVAMAQRARAAKAPAAGCCQQQQTMAAQLAAVFRKHKMQQQGKQGPYAGVLAACRQSAAAAHIVVSTSRLGYCVS